LPTIDIGALTLMTKKRVKLEKRTSERLRSADCGHYALAVLQQKCDAMESASSAT
jgi:hypothetical protein